MENLCNLLFELSNPARLRILRHLSKEGKKISHLSRELGLTTQESSRHLSRLSEAGLTRRDVEGLYHISPYGTLMLRELPVFEFTAEHKDYFATHSLKRLPTEFVSRIGELAESKYVKEVTAVFYTIERMIQEAEQYIYDITDEYIMSAYPLMAEARERGVKQRDVEAKTTVYPPETLEPFRAKYKQAVVRTRAAGVAQERFLDRLDIFLWMSEKEVAALAFPLLDGSFDHLGFIATDRRSRKWCRNLFEYYWERARPRATVAEEAYAWLRKRPEAVHVLKSIAAGEEVVGAEEWVSELENMGLIKQGKVTGLGVHVTGEFCMYCGAANPRSEAFCQTCGRKMPRYSSNTPP